MIAPIRRQIVVPTAPLESFEIFTREIGLWWPMAAHSVSGQTGTVAFTGDHLVETTATGTTSVWATVLDWKPGELLALSWFPGHSPETATQVSVHFVTVETALGGEGTLVTLEHTGWERLADPEGARAEYENGWPTVIGRFGGASLGAGDGSAVDRPVGADPSGNQDAESVDETWLILRHTAGPQAPASGPIFGHPDFREHAAFLGRLAQEGVLVAAGPMSIGAQPGAHGMAVLRVPSEQLAAYVESARTQDLAVVRGLLEVEPVTWHVMMHA